MQSAVRKWAVEASGSLSSLWTPSLRGNISVEMSKFLCALHMSASYGKQNISFIATLNTADKVGGYFVLHLRMWTVSIKM